MKISSRGRYSLESMLYLALLPDGEYASTRVISGATGISDGYLEQLFIPLKKAGLIRGIRGSSGGYMIARPAESITVGDVIRTVEGPLEPVACLGKLPCEAQDDCLARKVWGVLSDEINDCIDSMHLSDLVICYRTRNPEESAS